MALLTQPNESYITSQNFTSLLTMGKTCKCCKFQTEEYNVDKFNGNIIVNTTKSSETTQALEVTNVPETVADASDDTEIVPNSNQAVNLESSTDTDDFGNDLTTDGVLTLNNSVKGNIETALDSDYFAFSVIEGQTYQIDLQGSPTNKGTLEDTKLTIYDSDGNQLYFNDDVGDTFNSSIRFVADASTTYYVAAQGYDDLTGTYELSATTVEAPSYWLSTLDSGTRVTKEVYYTFQSSAPGYLFEEDTTGWSAFSEEEQTLVKNIFANISFYTDLVFVETNNAYQDNTISFQKIPMEEGALGYAYYPVEDEIGFSSSDVFISDALNADGTVTNWQTVYTHEIGHALGLAHPFEHSDISWMNTAENSTTWTHMAYDTYKEIEWQHLKLKPFDIAVLQSMYGVNENSRSGDNTYQFNSNKGSLIWDGSGTDTIDASSASASAFISLEQDTWSYIGDKTMHISDANQLTINKHTYIENAKGTNFADEIIGNQLDNKLYGGIGDDKLYGGKGDDDLDGGGYDDVLRGQDGNDKLYGGNGNDTLYGGNHNDALMGANGNDKLYGGNGNDKLYGGAGSDYLNGGVLNDYIKGGDGVDRLYGDFGNDRLYGDAGADELFGGHDQDFLSGGDDDDILTGEDGHDKLYGGHGNDTLNGGNHNDYLSGGLGDDKLYGGHGQDTMYGGRGVDFLKGGDSNDKLMGDGGNDLLYGGNQADELFGGVGRDYLNGGRDADIINGGLGQDTLVGGKGNDIFQFNSIKDSTVAFKDVITDFTQGEDKIDLSGIDANISERDNGYFHVMIESTDSFTYAGQLQFKDGVLYGNTDTDAEADFAIEVKDVNRLYLSDLVL